jgi:hypothetical protein
MKNHNYKPDPTIKTLPNPFYMPFPGYSAQTIKKKG